MTARGTHIHDLLASNFADRIFSIKKSLFEKIGLRGYFITIRNANKSKLLIKAPFVSLKLDECFGHEEYFGLYLANWINASIIHLTRP